MRKIVKVPKGGFKECPNYEARGTIFRMGFPIEMCNNCKALIYYFGFKEKKIQAEIFEGKRIN